MDAVEEGENFLKNSPEENRDIVGKLSDGDKEFFKLGAANTLRRNPTVLRKLVDRAGSFGNDMRDKMRPLFKSDADLDRFIQSVEHEVNMAETSNRVIGGSPTQERAMEDQYSNALSGFASGARAVGHAASGNWLAALHNALRARRDIGMLRTNQLRNLEIGKLLTDPTLEFGDLSSRRLNNAIPNNRYGP